MNTRSAVETFYEAAVKGDLSAMLGVLDDTIVVHEPPFLPYGGTYRGVEQFRALGRRVLAFLDVSRSELQSLVVDGDRAVATVEVPRVDDGEMMTLAEHWTFRNGKAVELTVFFWDPTPVTASPGRDKRGLARDEL